MQLDSNASWFARFEKLGRKVYTNLHCITELQTTRKIRIHLDDLVIKFRDFMSSRYNIF